MALPGQLQHRAAFADECQRAGLFAADRAGRLWLVDPQASIELLKMYDGGTGHIIKDDSKRTGLLKSSLTQADGPDWQRQRAAVVAAIGGGLTAQAARHSVSAYRAGSLAASLVADYPDIFDVMDLARMVAARGIVGAVVRNGDGNGGGDGDGAGDGNAVAEADVSRVEVVLSAFMKANRRRKEQKDEAVVNSLGDELQRCIHALYEHHRSKGTASGAATALLPRLMQRPDLSKEEVIGNVNSCLLAGVETTSLLIGCSLLRLACRPALRRAARAEICVPTSGDTTRQSKLVGAILKETLRVHPPVMGLPRVISCPEGLPLGPNGGRHLPVGTVFSVCLLAAAHTAGIPRTGDGEGEDALPTPLPSTPPTQPVPPATPLRGWTWLRQAVLRGLRGSLGQRNGPADAVTRARRQDSLRETKASWQWAVSVDAATDHPDGHKNNGNHSHAAPFGMGPRACPAGSLSLVVARHVLEALLSRFDWAFVDPAQASAERWVNDLISSPTLVVPSGLALRFHDIS